MGMDPSGGQGNTTNWEKILSVTPKQNPSPKPKTPKTKKPQKPKLKLRIPPKQLACYDVETGQPLIVSTPPQRMADELRKDQDAVASNLESLLQDDVPEPAAVTACSKILDWLADDTAPT